jgi:serine-type D-Ala-D-Ala carboxypeptidase (penicillin-binding protein 5/6)
LKKTALLIVILLFIAQPVSYASYAVIDGHTARIFYASSPHIKMPIASLTKIWTALVVVENAELDEIVTVSQKATLSEGSSIYLKEGQQVTVNELLHGLMMRSGNDAAMALAEHVGGSEEGFVFLMNERAENAGLRNTTFTNPSGLHHDNHLSTAYDTAKMLQIAMKNKKFKKIASAKHFNGPTTTWENKHKLMHVKDSGVVSGKTGYTKVAGRTLATYFSLNQKEFIVVTLNESNDWNFHLHLAGLVNDNYTLHKLIKKGTYKTTEKSTISIKQPVSLLISAKEYPELSHILVRSTNSIRPYAIWQVRIKNEPIYHFPVEIK